MTETSPANQPRMEKIQGTSCSVCWQDFNQVVELDQHIRVCHPDRIGTEEELFARRHAA